MKKKISVFLFLKKKLYSQIALRNLKKTQTMKNNKREKNY